MIQVRDDHTLNEGSGPRNRGESTDQKRVLKVYLTGASYK